MVPPFLEIDGRVMVIANWSPQLGAEHVLLLRPLDRRQSALVKKEMGDAYCDVFARLFPFDTDRLSGPRGSPASSEAS